jgi:CheY-like chemotaxis protein/DNA-directed RNA polymerase specialized sigma24 family protein
VLLIEDSPEDATLITRALERRFGAVDARVVETPEALAAALGDGRWDAAISDHSMPRLRLGQATVAMRATGFTGPVVLCTGALVRAVEADARAAGATACIDKREIRELPSLLDQLLRAPPAVEGPPRWATLDDVALRAAALSDESGAWQELVRRHTDALRAGGRAGLFAHGGPTDDDSIDEVVARSWRRVLSEDMRNLRQWDPARGSLGARLFGLALRVGWSMARQEHRRRARYASEPSPEAPDPRTGRPDDLAATRELSRFVRRWLAAQGADAARLLWLRREGHSVREIAERLGASSSAVHRRLQDLELELTAALEASGWHCRRRG